MCIRDRDKLFDSEIFQPFGMSETRFGPVEVAVPTVEGIPGGTVHDPKARVLKEHTGSEMCIRDRSYRQNLQCLGFQKCHERRITIGTICFF